jgi:purine-binding chemotaxis protein CheW
MQLTARPAATTSRNLVIIRIAKQFYALPIEPIVQLIEMVTITPLPQVNQAVAGVITVRGATVPVVDLRCVLGMAQVRRELHTPIVLVQVDGRTVGLVVDEVLDVRAVPVSRIVCPQSILPEGLGAVPLVEGLIRDQAGTVLLLDFAQLLRPLPDGRLAVQALTEWILPDLDRVEMIPTDGPTPEDATLEHWPEEQEQP